LLTPLEVPGWIEFNTWRTGFRAHPFTYSASAGGAMVRAVLYLDRRGRVRLPPRDPFLPIVFQSPHPAPSRRTSDWLKVAAPLVDEMQRRGVVNATSLDPDVDDVRPWSWRRFQVGVGYTYIVDFPFDLTMADRGTRRNVDKAAQLGMTVERVRDVGPVIECLSETEGRKGFSHGLGPRELRVADRLVGAENLRMYVCFDRQKEPASACIAIHAPDARAVAWIAGTRTAFLASGANHLMWRHVLDDLAASGATGLDFCGANIPPVADFKSRWNARLAPIYHVRTYTARGGARFLSEWLASRRSPTHPR
jgi:hypothetical protein